MSKKNDKNKSDKTLSLDDIQIKDSAKARSQNPVLAVHGDSATRIVEYKKVIEQIKALKTQQDELGEQIREEACSRWVSRALEGNTENFKMDAKGEAQLTYIVMDSYAKVDSKNRETIVAAGFEEYIERDQIQLVDDLARETQERIVKALVAEFGKDMAGSLLETRYKVRRGSLLEIVASGSRKMVMAAFSVLRPTTQLR